MKSNDIEKIIGHLEGLEQANPIYNDIKKANIIYKNAINIIPVEICRKYMMAPLYINQNKLTIKAASYQQKEKILKELRKMNVPFEIDIAFCTSEIGLILIINTLKKYYDVDFTEDEINNYRKLLPQ